MRDYTRISPAFWTGRTGRALRRNPDAQRLALYLLSCPAATMIGVFYVASPTICHEVGLEPEILDALWLVLEQLDFAYFDPETEMVWVPNMAREQLDDTLKPGDRRISGVVRQLDSIRRHRFARAFWDRYAVAFSIAGHGEAQALVGLFAAPAKPIEAEQGNACRASKPNTPSSEEQEQDLEQDPDPPPVLKASAPDQTRAGSTFGAATPARKVMPWDATLAFGECFRRYPNQNGRLDAAGAWQDLLVDYPGGEDALRGAILARFDAGMLKHHPYSGLQRYRPTFETFLRKRRWEDPESAPDDAPEAQAKLAAAARTAADLDATVSATNASLAALRVDPTKLPTAAELAEMRASTKGLARQLAEEKSA